MPLHMRYHLLHGEEVIRQSDDLALLETNKLVIELVGSFLQFAPSPWRRVQLVYPLTIDDTQGDRG